MLPVDFVISILRYETEVSFLALTKSSISSDSFALCPSIVFVTSSVSYVSAVSGNSSMLSSSSSSADIFKA